MWARLDFPRLREEDLETFRSLTEEQQKAAEASPEIIRLSIGCEDAKDIIADLSQALDSI